MPQGRYCDTCSSIELGGGGGALSSHPSDASSYLHGGKRPHNLSPLSPMRERLGTGSNGGGVSPHAHTPTYSSSRQERTLSPNARYKTTVVIMSQTLKSEIKEEGKKGRIVSPSPNGPRSNRSAELRKFATSLHDKNQSHFYYDPYRGTWSDYHGACTPHDHVEEGGGGGGEGSNPTSPYPSLRRKSPKSPSSRNNSLDRRRRAARSSDHLDRHSHHSPNDSASRVMGQQKTDWLTGRLNTATMDEGMDQYLPGRYRGARRGGGTRARRARSLGAGSSRNASNISIPGSETPDGGGGGGGRPKSRENTRLSTPSEHARWDKENPPPLFTPQFKDYLSRVIVEAYEKARVVQGPGLVGNPDVRLDPRYVPTCEKIEQQEVTCLMSPTHTSTGPSNYDSSSQVLEEEQWQRTNEEKKRPGSLHLNEAEGKQRPGRERSREVGTDYRQPPRESRMNGVGSYTGVENGPDRRKISEAIQCEGYPMEDVGIGTREFEDGWDQGQGQGRGEDSADYIDGEVEPPSTVTEDHEIQGDSVKDSTSSTNDMLQLNAFNKDSEPGTKSQKQSQGLDGARRDQGQGQSAPSTVRSEMQVYLNYESDSASSTEGDEPKEETSSPDLSRKSTFKKGAADSPQVRATAQSYKSGLSHIAKPSGEVQKELVEEPIVFAPYSNSQKLNKAPEATRFKKETSPQKYKEDNRSKERYSSPEKSKSDQEPKPDQKYQAKKTDRREPRHITLSDEKPQELNSPKSPGSLAPDAHIYSKSNPKFRSRKESAGISTRSKAFTDGSGLFSRKTSKFIPDEIEEQEFEMDDKPDNYGMSLNSQTDLSHIFDFDEDEVGTKVEKEVPTTISDFDAVKSKFDTRLIYAEMDENAELRVRKYSDYNRISKGLVPKLQKHFDTKEFRARREQEFYKSVHDKLRYKHDSMKEWDPTELSPFDEKFVTRSQYKYHVRESRSRHGRSLSLGRVPIDEDFIARNQYRYTVRESRSLTRPGFYSASGSLLNTPSSSYTELDKVKPKKDRKGKDQSSKRNTPRNVKHQDQQKRQPAYEGKPMYSRRAQDDEMVPYEQYDMLPPAVDDRKQLPDEPDKLGRGDKPDQLKSEAETTSEEELLEQIIVPGKSYQKSESTPYQSGKPKQQRDKNVQTSPKKLEKASPISPGYVSRVEDRWSDKLPYDNKEKRGGGAQDPRKSGGSRKENEQPKSEKKSKKEKERVPVNRIKSESGQQESDDSRDNWKGREVVNKGISRWQKMITDQEKTKEQKIKDARQFRNNKPQNSGPDNKREPSRENDDMYEEPVTQDPDKRKVQSGNMMAFYSPKEYRKGVPDGSTSKRRPVKDASPTSSGSDQSPGAYPGNRDPFSEDLTSTVTHETESTFQYFPKSGKTIKVENKAEKPQFDAQDPVFLIKTVNRTTEEELTHIESLDDLQNMEIDDSVREHARHLAEKQKSSGASGRSKKKYVPRDQSAQMAKYKSYDNLHHGFDSSSLLLIQERSRSMDELNSKESDLNRSKDNTEHSQNDDDDAYSPLHQHNSSSFENVLEIAANQLAQQNSSRQKPGAQRPSAVMSQKELSQGVGQSRHSLPSPALSHGSRRSRGGDSQRERVIKKVRSDGQSSKTGSQTSLNQQNSSHEKRSFGNQQSSGRKFEDIKEVPSEQQRSSRRPRVEEAEVKYTFRAFTDRELAAQKGDWVQLVRRVDENWVEAELRAARGIIPINYLNISPSYGTKEPSKSTQSLNGPARAPASAQPVGGNSLKKSAVVHPVQQQQQQPNSQDSYDVIQARNKQKALQQQKSQTLPQEKGASQGNREGNMLQGKVKFHFEAKTAAELPLRKNDIVTIKKQVDENWYHGYFGSQQGIFPVSYVEVIPDTAYSKPPEKEVKHSRPQAQPQSQERKEEWVSPYDKTLMDLKNSNAFKKNGAGHLQPQAGHTQGQGQGQGNADMSYLASPSPTSQRAQPQPQEEAFKVLYPYAPEQADELQLQVDDIILVVEKCDDGWFVGTSQTSGNFGTFPGNYVQRVFYQQ